MIIYINIFVQELRTSTCSPQLRSQRTISNRPLACICSGSSPQEKEVGSELSDENSKMFKTFALCLEALFRGYNDARGGQAAGQAHLSRLQQLRGEVPRRGNGVIGPLALDMHCGAAEVGEFRDPLLHGDIQRLPTRPQLFDNVIGEHHHQGMGSGTLLQVHVDRAHLEVGRLARPKGPFDQRQILIALMDQLLPHLFRREIGGDHVTAIEFGGGLLGYSLQREGQPTVFHRHGHPGGYLQFRALRREFAEGHVDFRTWMLGEIPVVLLDGFLQCLLLLLAGLLHFLRADRIAAHNIA